LKNHNIKAIGIQTAITWGTVLFLILIISSVPPASTSTAVKEAGSEFRLSRASQDKELYKVVLSSQDRKVVEGTIEANEIKEYQRLITIPTSADPGYVKLVITNQRAPLSVKVTSADNHQQVILNGPFGTQNISNTITAYFSVQPGTAYDVTLLPREVDNSQTRKYQMSWKFVEMLDRYEPNDSRSQAASVVFNKIIQAYAIDGYHHNPTANRQIHDWFKVEIREPKRIKAQITEAPSNLRLETSLYDEFGVSIPVMADLDLSRGLHRVTSIHPLKPGTYFIGIYPVSSASKGVFAEQQVVPQHFNRPYRFVLSKF
jgi:hypothetical protein